MVGAGLAAAHAKEEAKDYCPRTGEEHERKHWTLLGKRDNGRWAWRCGNCLEVRESEKEGGGPDPVRAHIGVAVSPERK